MGKKDFWNTGDAEYHEEANRWASKKFGNDWHEKYEWWWIGKLYDRQLGSIMLQEDNGLKNKAEIPIRT